MGGPSTRWRPAHGTLHASADAYADGRLSYSKIRTLTRVATVENELELLELAFDTPAGDLLHYDHNPPYEETEHTVIDELELRCAPCHRNRHAAA